LENKKISAQAQLHHLGISGRGGKFPLNLTSGIWNDEWLVACLVVRP